MEENTLSVNFADAFNNSNAFREAYKMAQFMSKSSLIPSAYQDKPQDILLAFGLAERLKVSLVEVLNGINIIKGRPSFSAQFAITLANTRGPFTAPIQYETKGEGESLQVTARATLKNGEEVKATVSMQMARMEEWTKNPKYRSMPEHMLKLRAATFLIRTTCPEILAGYHTNIEVDEMKTSTSSINLNQKIKELNHASTHA